MSERHGNRICITGILKIVVLLPAKIGLHLCSAVKFIITSHTATRSHSLSFNGLHLDITHTQITAHFPTLDGWKVELASAYP